MGGRSGLRWAKPARYAVVLVTPALAGIAVGYSMSGSLDRVPWNPGIGILGLLAIISGDAPGVWRPFVPLVEARKAGSHFRLVLAMVILALVAGDAYASSRTIGGVVYLWRGVGIELVLAVGYSLLLWGPALWKHPADVVPT